MATTLKKNVVSLGWAAFLLIGAPFQWRVLSVGPLVAFGFLLIHR